jgi:hypothetical protein
MKSIFALIAFVVLSSETTLAARLYLIDTPTLTVFKEDDVYGIAGTVERVTADETSQALPVRFKELTIFDQPVYIEKSHVIGLQVLLAAAGGSKRTVVTAEKTSTGYKIKTVELRN